MALVHLVLENRQQNMMAAQVNFRLWTWEAFEDVLKEMNVVG